MGSYSFLITLTVVHILLLGMTAKGTIVDHVKNGTKDYCQKVECGKGKCVEKSEPVFWLGSEPMHKHGFNGGVCECDPGWNQIKVQPKYISRNVPLPCVVPQCTINEDPKKPQPRGRVNDADLHRHRKPKNFACRWNFCGEGGKCTKTEDYKYRCECKPNYFNILNMTSLPCTDERSIGPDCAKLGITAPNSTVEDNAVLSTSSSSRGMKIPLDSYMFNVHLHGYAMGGN